MWRFGRTPKSDGGRARRRSNATPVSEVLTPRVDGGEVAGRCDGARRQAYAANIIRNMHCNKAARPFLPPLWDAILIAASCNAVVLMGASSAGAAGGGQTGASSASSPFCADARQLQTWGTAQQPGPDQYDNPDGQTVLNDDAPYLEKLATEAPAGIKPALVEWANFAEALDPNDSNPAVANQLQSATNAANRVENWMVYDSSCSDPYRHGEKVFNSIAAPTNKKANSGGFHLPWFWIGAGLVLLLIVGFVVGKGGSSEEDVQTASVRPDPAPRRTFGASTQQKRSCLPCNGRGKTNCQSCGGTGRATFGPSLGPQAGPTNCGMCQGRGYITCTACRGTGTT
jgi:hypothetical protein